MTVLTRWEPFREIAALQDRLNRTFNDQLRGLGERDTLTGSFVPPVDIYEDEQGLQLRMEIPGVDEKDLNIEIENNILTVRGERKFEKDVKEENFHRVERRYGSFTRSFTLPNTVNTEDVKAESDRGVLTLKLAKRAEAKPKQIKVNVGSQLAQQAS
jgi:HSP20 family protein